jgi:hypothetical protein
MTAAKSLTRHVVATALSLAIVLGLALASPAWALPVVGSAAPTARLKDPDDRAVSIEGLRGRLALIVYEDKSSSGQNQVLIRELKAQAAKLDPGAPITFVPVADVSGYNFWPVKGIARNTVRNKAREGGYPIFCDWDGQFRAKFQLQRSKSNVVLVGRNGRVLFAKAGTLTTEERGRLLQILASELTPLTKTKPPATPSQAQRD